jgi:hypothetical protein
LVASRSIAFGEYQGGFWFAALSERLEGDVERARSITLPTGTIASAAGLDSLKEVPLAERLGEKLDSAAPGSDIFAAAASKALPIAANCC